jgi:hypothetical protein
MNITREDLEAAIGTIADYIERLDMIDPDEESDEIQEDLKSAESVYDRLNTVLKGQAQ